MSKDLSPGRALILANVSECRDTCLWYYERGCWVENQRGCIQNKEAVHYVIFTQGNYATVVSAIVAITIVGRGG